jgi:hypothetical protein
VRQRDRVKGPILIPFALVLALMVAALLAISYGYEAQAQRQDLAASKRAVEHMLTMEIDSHAAKLHAALFPLSGDEALRNAFEARQRDDLLERVQPLFEEMRERFDVTHFYLVDPERSVVLRVHEPDFSRRRDHAPDHTSRRKNGPQHRQHRTRPPWDNDHSGSLALAR